jgi:hypothetical protein
MTPLGDGKRHCMTCHQSLGIGQHGWVAIESRFDPEHRRPREMIPCPTCMVTIGREAPREDDREYQAWKKRGAR